MRHKRKCKFGKVKSGARRGACRRRRVARRGRGSARRSTRARRGRHSRRRTVALQRVRRAQKQCKGEGSRAKYLSCLRLELRGGGESTPMEPGGQMRLFSGHRRRKRSTSRRSRRRSRR